MSLENKELITKPKDKPSSQEAKDCYVSAINNNPNVDFKVVYKTNPSKKIKNNTIKDALALRGKKNVTLIPTRKSHGNMNTDFFDGEYIT